MIEMRLTGETMFDWGPLARAFAVCDVCGELITPLSTGNMYWTPFEGPAQLRMAHKSCNAEFERRFGRQNCWDNLDRLPLQLIVGDEPKLRGDLGAPRWAK